MKNTENQLIIKEGIELMLGKDAFPDYIIISIGITTSETPPYERSLLERTIWTGDCDCQSGGTYDRQFVSESTHTVFCEKITSQIDEGANVTILKENSLPIYGKVVQSESKDIFEDNGIVYGTTIWVKQTKS